MQTAAVAAVKRSLPGSKDPQAAVVAIDPKTGAVRAMYGGRNYQKQQFNLATDAMRQAGSTMKPFVLEQWLKDGYSIKSTFKGPSKIIVDGQEIHNYGDASYGWVDLQQATRSSINTVYMQLIEKAGPARVADIARKTGVNAVLSSNERRPNLTPNPSLALGSSGLSTLQLASAYGTWANRGVHLEPYLIEDVTDLAGRPIELNAGNNRSLGRHQLKPVRVVDENVAKTINQTLSGVIQRGSGTAARIGRPAAGKTGTTNDYTDARFVGYTPDLVASVWMGYLDERQKLYNVRGIPAVSGGSLPAVIWRDFMTQATSGSPRDPLRRAQRRHRQDAEPARYQPRARHRAAHHQGGAAHHRGAEHDRAAPVDQQLHPATYLEFLAGDHGGAADPGRAAAWRRLGWYRPRPETCRPVGTLGRYECDARRHAREGGGGGRRPAVMVVPAAGAAPARPVGPHPSGAVVGLAQPADLLGRALR